MVMGRKASQVFTLDEEHTVTSIDEEDIDFIEQRYSEGATKLKLRRSFDTPEELQGRQGGSNAGGRGGLQRGMSLTVVLNSYNSDDDDRSSSSSSSSDNNNDGADDEFTEQAQGGSAGAGGREGLQRGTSLTDVLSAQ